MLADYHLHTSFSDDSEFPMEASIQQAIALGIREVCYTEHIDYGVKTDLNCDCEAYWKEIRRCRELYGDCITIKGGMEFGIQTGTVSVFKRTFQKYPFDFIIFSCHQVDNQEFWNGCFQQGRSQREYHEKYYEEILKVMNLYEDFSVLGHLDMIRRYDPLGEYPFHNVQDMIEKILKTVIEKGKGIEVNTSGYRYGLQDVSPSVRILKLYREFGGEIITIGSDAHKMEDMGYRLSDTQSLLKDLGFRYFCTYDHMTPIYQKL